MLKENLWKENHPSVAALRKIPEIVSKEDGRYDEIIRSCISLKTLFEREKMDEYHVDCLVLYRIALGVLYIMERLWSLHILPGLYDLKDFYVDMHSGYQIYLLHPERFQMLQFEQDYEWYPEDERVFGDLVLFDEDSQRKADTRLLYKILVASVKGNVKVPPKDTRADYSSLFYKTLSPELKDIFLKEEDISHEQCKALLEDAIALERESARKVRERQNEWAKKMVDEPMMDEPMHGQRVCSDPGEVRSCIYSMFVLLRTETANSGRISKMLYQEQDKLELETGLSIHNSLQAFVYGNGFVRVRDFRLYPEGFRIQCEQSIRDYSSAEAIVIACELVENVMKQIVDESAVFRVYLITDGRLKNDQIFQYALGRLEKLKKLGCELRFIYDLNCSCEACSRLKQMCGQYL